MKTLKQIAGLLLLASFAYAAEAPSLTAEVKATLLSKYKSVLLEQAKVQSKIAEFNVEYNKALAGLPKGTQISVDPDKDSVDVIPPPEPKKEEAKPEKK